MGSLFDAPCGGQDADPLPTPPGRPTPREIHPPWGGRAHQRQAFVQERPSQSLPRSRGSPGTPQREPQEKVGERSQPGAIEDHPGTGRIDCRVRQRSLRVLLEPSGDGAHLAERGRDPTGRWTALRALADPCGHDAMPDAVSLVGRVLVARVLSPRLAGGPKVRFDVGARRLEQRPQPASAPRAHGSEPRKAGAAHETHQQRFHLIVGRVRGGDEIRSGAPRRLKEEATPQPPQTVLAGPAKATHALPGIPARALERHAEPEAKGADEGLVGVRVEAAQPVMKVRGAQLDLELGGQAVETQEECYRVGSAAHRDQDSKPLSRGARAAKGAAQNRLDASRPPVLGGWWRRRDSNPGHRDYDSPALPAELRRRTPNRDGRRKVGRGWNSVKEP